jgi:hypothetical protein
VRLHGAGEWRYPMLVRSRRREKFKGLGGATFEVADQDLKDAPWSGEEFAHVYRALVVVLRDRELALDALQYALTEGLRRPPCHDENLAGWLFLSPRFTDLNVTAADDLRGDHRRSPACDADEFAERRVANRESIWTCRLIAATRGGR